MEVPVHMEQEVEHVEVLVQQVLVQVLVAVLVVIQVDDVEVVKVVLVDRVAMEWKEI